MISHKWKEERRGEIGSYALRRKRDGEVWLLRDPHEVNMSNGEENDCNYHSL